jgi:hypothetical protein
MSKVVNINLNVGSEIPLKSEIVKKKKKKVKTLKRVLQPRLQQPLQPKMQRQPLQVQQQIPRQPIFQQPFQQSYEQQFQKPTQRFDYGSVRGNLATVVKPTVLRIEELPKVKERDLIAEQRLNKEWADYQKQREIDDKNQQELQKRQFFGYLKNQKIGEEIRNVAKQKQEKNRGIEPPYDPFAPTLSIAKTIIYFGDKPNTSNNLNVEKPETNPNVNDDLNVVEIPEPNANDVLYEPEAIGNINVKPKRPRRTNMEVSQAQDMGAEDLRFVGGVLTKKIKN